MSAVTIGTAEFTEALLRESPRELESTLPDAGSTATRPARVKHREDRAASSNLLAAIRRGVASIVVRRCPTDIPVRLVEGDEPGSIGSANVHINCVAFDQW